MARAFALSLSVVCLVACQKAPFGPYPQGLLTTGVTAISPIPDGSGKIYVGGDFSSYFQYGPPQRYVPLSGIARLNSDGSLDPGFQSGRGFDQQVLTLAAAADGSQ